VVGVPNAVHRRKSLFSLFRLDVRRGTDGKRRPWLLLAHSKLSTCRASRALTGRGAPLRAASGGDGSTD
jgi:hypothetical protein